MQPSEESQTATLLTKIKRIGLIVIFSGLIIFITIFIYGSQQTYKDDLHTLYDTFDVSPEHIELVNSLKGSKKSIVYGKKQAGLFQFAEHYASVLSMQEGRSIYIEDISKKHFKMYKIAQAARKRIDKWFGLEKQQGDWFIYSRDGNVVPQDIIDKIIKGNPNSKITIFTPSPRQRNRGFKEFAYPELSEHEVEESIERNFGVSENTADILFDYFETVENAFKNMKHHQFSPQKFLGDNYRDLQGLSKEDNRILKDLCKKGQGDSAKESLALTELGVVYYNGENYWRNPEARLNYELHKDLNCQNKLIPEDIMKEVEELKEREAEEMREKEERRASKKGKKNKH